MRRDRALWVLGACASLVASAAAQSSPTPVNPHGTVQTALPRCPLSIEQVSRHFGHTFKTATPEAGLLGRGCVYASAERSGPKLWLDMGPNPFPTLEMYRKLSAPPGTTWRPVPGDPDRAVHTVPRADVPPFPSLSYERKGWIVSLTVTGFDGSGSLDSWNSRLVQLPRLP